MPNKRRGRVPLGWSLLFLLVISLASMTFPAHAASSDLTIDSIWLEDASQPGQPISQLSPGQSFNIIATIKNIGQETAAGYYLDVYYDSDYGHGGPDSIAPGEVQTWYVGPFTAQAGTHTTKWVADPDNQIAELDETNNQKGLAFTVGSQTVTTTTTLTSNSTPSTTQSTSTTAISANTYASESPFVADSGSYVYVAWSDSTPVSGSGGQPEIWLRISSNNGASFGSPIRMSTNTGYSLHPSVAASGSYVYVAWQDSTPVPGSGDNEPEIWMRVSSNHGASFGPAIRISSNAYNSLYPSVAADGSYVYVAWQDNTLVAGSGSSYEIWMRVGSNNGAVFGSPMRISTNTYDSTFASVAASGGYVYVAWQDSTPVPGSGTAPEIWMRVSPNNGASFGSAIRISTNTYDSSLASVAASGGYLYVAWQDNTPVSGSGSSYEIWMRISSNNGAVFGSAVRMSTNSYDSDYPRVAASGSYLYVAWQDYTPVAGSGVAAEVWLRSSSNNGASFGSAVRVSTNTYDSLHPAVAANGNIVFLAWEDYTPVSGSGSGAEIWLKAVS